jgi:hypothetical protein
MIYGRIKNLYEDFDTKNKKVRLIGVKASNLSRSDRPDSLFDEEGQVKTEKIHKAVDAIKEKFGDGSIYRAGGKK